MRPRVSKSITGAATTTWWVALTLVLLLLCLTIQACSGKQTTWWNTNWARKIKIEFTNPESATTEPWANFTMLVVLNPARFDYTLANSDLSDIRFVWDDDSTLLEHELEVVNTTGTSTIWVRLPLITPYQNVTTKSYFWMYFSNAAVTASPGNGSMWSDYISVYHGKGWENPVQNAPMLDSGPNKYHLSSSMPGTFNFYGEGKIGKARSFNGSFAYSIQNAPKITSVKNIQLWVLNLGPMCDDAYSVGGLAGAGTILGLYMYPQCTMPGYRSPIFDVFFDYDSWAPEIYPSSFHTWAHVIVQFVPDPSTPSVLLQLFVNGQLAASTTSEYNYLSNNKRLTIGVSQHYEYLSDDSMLDEVRFGYITRSADWFAYEYRVQSDLVISYATPDAACGIKSLSRGAVKLDSSSSMVVLVAGVPRTMDVIDVQACSLTNSIQVTFTSATTAYDFSSSVVRDTADLSVYHFLVNITKADTYMASILLNDVPVLNSPINVTIVPSDYSGTVASGPGVLSAIVKLNTSFTVVFSDLFGNPHAPSSFSFYFENNNGQRFDNWPLSVSQLDPVTFLVEYEPAEVGQYSLWMLVDNSQYIELSSALSIQCDDTSNTYTTLHLNLTMHPKESYLFDIDLRTMHNIPQQCLDGISFACAVYDVGTGQKDDSFFCNTTTTQVTMQSQKTGNYTIKLSLQLDSDRDSNSSNTIISGSSSSKATSTLLPVAVIPETIEITPGPLGICEVSGLSSSTLVNTQGHFIVNLRDKHGFIIRPDGHTLTYWILPSSGYAVQIKTVNVEEGFKILYTFGTEGTYNITLTIDTSVCQTYALLTIRDGSSALPSSDNALVSSNNSTSEDANAIILSQSLPLPVIIGAVVGGTVGLVLLCLVFLVVASVVIIRKRNNYREFSSMHTTSTAPSTSAYEMSDLKNMSQRSDLDSANSYSSSKGKSMPTISVHSSTWEINENDIKELVHIGSGNYGIVYKGKLNGEYVALKKLKMPQCIEDERSWNQVVAEFENEVNLLATLRHPNVLGFRGAILKMPNVGIVTEYMELGTLAELIYGVKKAADAKPKKTVCLTWDQKLKIMQDVATGLAYLHRARIIHRDLKPANILITKGTSSDPENKDYYMAKISDLGISKMKEISTSQDESKHNTVQVGTALWMAPEVTLGEKYGTACDVFSFGIIMSEILVERLPYADYEYKSSANVRVAMQPNLRPNVSEELRVRGRNHSQASEDLFVSVMRQCWQHAPEDRPHMSEVVAKFEEMLQLARH